MSFTIPMDYGYVVLTASLMGLQLTMTGFGYVGNARRKVFGDKFKAAAEKAGLVEQHKAATGEAELPKGGYPDMGTGRYSDLLSYGEWFEFACAQRAHYNYLEAFGPVSVFLLTGGLAYPKLASAAGLLFMMGRWQYAKGYAGQGGSPNKRYSGPPVGIVGLLGLFLLSLASGVKISGLADSLSGLIKA